MKRKKVLDPAQVRKTGKSFCFISHRFLADGFLQALTRHELALYFFLVLASDRNVLSFYINKTICSILAFKEDEYIFVRSCLIHKDLVMHDGTLFQVLSLPESVHKEVAQ